MFDGVRLLVLVLVHLIANMFGEVDVDDCEALLSGPIDVRLDDISLCIMSVGCLQRAVQAGNKTYQPRIVQLDLACARVWRREHFRRIVQYHK